MNFLRIGFLFVLLFPAIGHSQEVTWFAFGKKVPSSCQHITEISAQGRERENVLSELAKKTQESGGNAIQALEQDCTKHVVGNDIYTHCVVAVLLCPPKIGEIIGEYKFLGGDAKEEKNWQKVIMVKRKSDGVIGTIPENEWDPKLYKKVK